LTSEQYQAARVALPPIAPGLYRLETGGEPTLLGGGCRPCERRFYPRPPICPGCLGEIREIELGSRGTLYSHTVIRVKPPFGLPQPYAVGYVDLADSDLRVFSLLDAAAIDRYTIGQALKLAVGAIGHDGDGNPCLRPYFMPVVDDQRQIP
jgi:uncharacterized OB-fold protein